jgi:hypothetical protein
MKVVALEGLLPQIQDDKFYAAYRSGNNYRGSGNSTHLHWNMNGPFESREEAEEKNYWKIHGFHKQANKFGTGKSLKWLMQYDALGGRKAVTGNIFLGHNPDGGPI